MYMTIRLLGLMGIDAIRFRHTVVPSDESIPVTPSQLPIDILLGFLERNVHITVNRLKLSCFVPSVSAAACQK
jgi:hypothetical protein